MSFDNLCKLLSEKYPQQFATWVLGTPQTDVTVLKTELSIEPIRADYVTLLQIEGRILHLEFQTKIESTPPLPLRMLDYWVRLYRLYRLPITQVVVLLLPPKDNTEIPNAFHVENTRHEYRVIKMWEENPEPFLENAALLPLASLAASNQPQVLLEQIVQRVNQLETTQRPEISAYTQILAGLKFRKDLIRTLFREGMMRESVIYQEILEEGEQKGEQRGRLEGEQRERTLVLRLLARKVGELSPNIHKQLQTLSLEQLENLGEALLDFSSVSDLENWLAHN
ncbi:Rpn family recombination-promoting nuclease/putative transposase [Nodularia spumigena CS-591/12]|uniref:Rpn family recombination-promoting nuclease/putative transposase n=1 Tax=Cyanophyceae TaxID=3028117 RepID=UPI00232EB97C|nr:MULTISPECIES: Rpn family recombination-promoting nuclease/putative transposase [Cyanophyceae]MDB9306602.1 Rpn family recombination-promoting nuclease/putative transposase [Nodularia spumigena CS-591/12]MDB9343910.1 Rpn family recombination-promoting nuclease/putative transposase [Nodularia spumigena CS-588/06]MDB9399648.1 Rpn family recombination-promoting nuclease/putative transposase [Microcystis aeruginosa CS-567/02-A1]